MELHFMKNFHNLFCFYLFRVRCREILYSFCFFFNMKFELIQNVSIFKLNKTNKEYKTVEKIKHAVVEAGLSETIIKVK